MTEFSLWKKIRKRLRKKRRPLWMLGCVVAVIAASTIFCSTMGTTYARSYEPPDETVINQLLVKQKAFIGIDKEGNLSLYDGNPKEEKVMQTFFQLDVKYMESSLPQDKLDLLEMGIQIGDIDEYNSVIATYSDYALNLHEKVMRPAF